ncbi:hypothetical protein ENBRE01_2619 [Enteropsectra breve]|nr:hypothetical protein ENBRE01_2619 [Enteropsectra breve]
MYIRAKTRLSAKNKIERLCLRFHKNRALRTDPKYVMNRINRVQLIYAQHQLHDLEATMFFLYIKTGDVLYLYSLVAAGLITGNMSFFLVETGIFTRWLKSMQKKRCSIQERINTKLFINFMEYNAFAGKEREVRCAMDWEMKTFLRDKNKRNYNIEINIGERAKGACRWRSSDFNKLRNALKNDGLKPPAVAQNDILPQKYDDNTFEMHYSHAFYLLKNKKYREGLEHLCKAYCRSDFYSLVNYFETNLSMEILELLREFHFFREIENNLLWEIKIDMANCLRAAMTAGLYAECKEIMDYL